MPDDYDPMMGNGQLVNDQVGTSLQMFTHPFTPMMGDDSNTGVAFFGDVGAEHLRGQREPDPELVVWRHIGTV